MSELIDRQALLEECLNHYEVGNIEQNCTMDWICKTVRNFPAASSWHRVEDGLPDRYDAYVVGWRYPNGCFYWGKVLFLNDKWQVDEEIPTPDYWMPIEPPKEDA